MLLGAAGVVTSLTSLLLSFTDATDQQTALRLVVLVGGLVGLRLLAGSRLVDRLLRRVTEFGIYRKGGSYLGVPISTTVIEPGDRVVAYGEDEAIPELSERLGGEAGDRDHERAVTRYQSKRARVATAE